jgi:predicted outer membrane repeat protein
MISPQQFRRNQMMSKHTSTLGRIAIVLAMMAAVFLAAPLQSSAPVNASGIQPLTPLRSSSSAGQPLAPATPSALAWYDGMIQYSSVTNCASIIQGFPYQEYGVGTYVGFRADPNAGQPAPNTTYYVHVVITGLGNPCSGGTRAYMEVALPANTSLAINVPDVNYKVFCYYDGAPLAPASACPQVLPASSYNAGAYAILSTDSVHGNTWTMAQGHTLEIQIPVRSTTTLVNSQLQANIWAIDGNSSPWLRPQQGVFVFNNQPTIIYPSPATISMTANTAHSMVYLYTFGATGTGHFELGATTSYGLINEAVPIPTPGTAWFAWDDWGPPSLQPDTLFHWRFTFTTSGGQTYYGTDQTFRTLPDGQVTIGIGSPAGCTETAFNSALATAKDIRFDCGALPITITLSGAKTINSDVTIEGGHKVTLSGGPGQWHFSVQPGAHLTLTQISLVNGTGNAVMGGCGGSIHVAGNAQLFLSETYFYNNQTGGNGGALCIELNGYASIYYSQFVQNSAPYGGGGAIYNAGRAEMYWSDISSNSAYSSGGGIYSSGTMTVAGSLIYGNSASNINSSGSGGGVYNLGTASFSASTVSSNFANYGGGIANDGSGLTLTGLTIAYNAADPGGFGTVRFTGAGGLLSGPSATNASLRNTLLAGNWPGNCAIIGVFRTWTSSGNNLDDQDRCQLRGLNDLHNANPKLGPLQNNGGRTRTHALNSGSAAIDTGNNVYCGLTDQRGFAGPSGRQVDGNRDGVAVCDIGAYEYRPQTFLPMLRR